MIVNDFIKLKLPTQSTELWPIKGAWSVIDWQYNDGQDYLSGPSVIGSV